MNRDYIRPDFGASFSAKLARAELRWKRVKWLAAVVLPSLAALLLLALWKLVH